MNIVLFFLILTAFFSNNYKLLFGLAFVSGLILDLFFGNLLGLTSLLFLGVCFFIYLYKNRFSSSHILFQVGVVIISDFLINYLKGGIWSYKKSILLLVLSLIIFPLVNKIKKTSHLSLEV